MKKTTISVPIYLVQPRKTKKDKKYSLSMNAYRNWQFHLSNVLKRQFKDIVRPQLEGKTFNNPSIEYFLYFPDKRRRDKFNFASIVAKFFLDAMVECNCIEDDNDSFIGRESVEFIGVDKESPRCEVVLTEID